MNKHVKIAAIAAAVVVVAALVLFAVIPLATSGEAERRVSEVFAEAGIPEEHWRMDGAKYIPLFNDLVIKNLQLRDSENDSYETESVLDAGKLTLSIKNDSEELFEGSLNVGDLSFPAGGFRAGNLAVTDFAFDKALAERSPAAGITKIKAVSLGDVVFSPEGKPSTTLKSVSVDLNYTGEGFPRSTALTVKDLAIDLRDTLPVDTLRPEYRISSLVLKSEFSRGDYNVNLDIDGKDLFTIKSAYDLELPEELVNPPEGMMENYGLAVFGRMPFNDRVMFNSFNFTYTDKSLLDHILEVAGMADREEAADELYETFEGIASMSGLDRERFADEAADFIAKRGGKLELKTNLDSPMSFRQISRNPLGINLSLSINGGEPFVTE